MSKGTIMLGIAGVIIVAGAGAAGAMLAVNSESGNMSKQKVEILKEQPKEEVKLNGWKEESGNWYFYKDNGKQNNWVQDKESWYYLGSDGKMRTGWIKDNGNWYYLNNDGTMATNTTIDNCYLNEKGIIEETPSNSSSTVNNDISSNTVSSKYVVNSFEQAKNIILKEDGQYINNENKKESKNNAYIQLNNHKVETINDEASSWGIPNEECYTICIGYYINGKLDTDDGAYLVGRETGNVYIIPHQGCFSAYQIKNNKVAKRFKWPRPDAAQSPEWR